MRAMVIDDSRAMRMILKRIVAKLNFETVEAGDGQEALDLLATMTEVPDLALIDWNMPNMNGLEFVTKVRADARLREMTLVMVTTEMLPTAVPAPMSDGLGVDETRTAQLVSLWAAVVVIAIALLAFAFGYGAVLSTLEDQVACLFVGAALGVLWRDTRSPRSLTRFSSAPSFAAPLRAARP